MPEYACLIDTSYIESQAFCFDDVAFKKLKLFSAENVVDVLNPSLIVDEVGHRARERFQSFFDSLNKSFKQGYTLKSYEPVLYAETEALITRMGQCDPKALATGLMRNYMDECGSTAIDTGDIRIGSLYENYFDKTAPFGPGKKRKEFVDAGVIDLIDQYHDRTGLDVCIVSKDGDFASCSQTREWLSTYESLSDLLEDRHDDDEHAALVASGPLQEHWEEIVAAIETQLSNHLELYVEDLDGDVQVEKVSVLDSGDKQFVSLDDDHIGVLLDANLNVCCFVTMADPDLTAWDKGPVVLSHRKGNIERQINASLQLEFDPALFEDGYFEPEHIHVNISSKLIDVDPYELDEDPSFYD